MNYLRKTAILALAIVMALSTIAVASASTPGQAEDTQGIFGTFVKRDGTFLTVMTKEGEITVAVTGESAFKAPGTKEGFTLDDLTTEDKLAIQVAQREGARVAVRIMRMPRQPTYVHRVEVVVSAEGSTLTVTDRDGNTRVINVPQDVAQNIVGQVVTTINRELRDADKEATREAKGLVRAEKTKEKLEDYLEKVGGQQAEGDADVQQKGREVERRVAHLQRLQQQAISILEELVEEAPEQAKEALNRALELATQSREISEEVIQRVEHASKVELGKVKGVIEAINVDAGTIDVAFENGNVVTVRIADEAKIVRDDEKVFLEDLAVGDVIVRAAYNPETFTAHALVIRTPENEEPEKLDGDTAIHLRETLKGYIKAIDPAGNTIQVSSSATSSSTGPESTVTITEDTKIEKNGEVVTLADLAIGDFVLVVLNPQGGNALQLLVRSPADVEKPEEVDGHRKVVKGHIVSIQLDGLSITIAEAGEEATDTIADAGEEATGITVRITEKTRIVRNGKDGTLLREFAAGDALLHLVYDVETMEAVMIVVDARKVNRPTMEILKLHGVIKSLDPSAGSVTLATNRGIVEVTVSPDTRVIKNGQAATLADLEPRDVVEAAVNTETKMLLSLEVRATVSITPLKPSPSATNATGVFELKGVIRGLDPDSRTLALVTREGSRKFHVAEDAEIKKNGEVIKFQDLELGNIVEVEIDPGSETILKINVTSAQEASQTAKPEARNIPSHHREQRQQQEREHSLMNNGALAASWTNGPHGGILDNAFILS